MEQLKILKIKNHLNDDDLSHIQIMINLTCHFINFFKLNQIKWIEFKGSILFLLKNFLSICD